MLIHNVTIFTNDEHNTVLHDQAVVIEGTRIVAIGASADLQSQHPSAEQIDGAGRLLMPGFTNTHMHFYGMYARGMSLNATPHNFHEILIHLWWALDKVLDAESVYYSTLIPAISAVQHGVTSIIDQIEQALSEIGVRGLLCYEVSDRDGKAIRDAGLAENERYIRKCQAAKAANPDHLFDGMMGLHASFTVDDETLEKAVALANQLDRGCHIHMLEDFVDETATQERYGRSVVERLDHFGVLGNKSITAHGIFLDDDGRKRLADSDTIVVHQAQSNMNNAVGRADIFALLESGVTVGIGTDGMSADLRREVMTGYLMHKHHVGDNNLGWVEYEQMAMKNNPAIYQRLTGQKVGRVEVGYLADLILVDYFPPTPFTGDNYWGHFLFGLIDSPVNTTMINGKIVMHDKVVLGINERVIAAQSREVAQRIWKKYHHA
jgi:putative selenium metabolism protein SsnA